MCRFVPEPLDQGHPVRMGVAFPAVPVSQQPQKDFIGMTGIDPYTGYLPWPCCRCDNRSLRPQTGRKGGKRHGRSDRCGLNSSFIRAVGWLITHLTVPM